MKIYLTGSPGTGKTTLSKEFQKSYISDLNFKVFEIRELLEENDLLEEYEQDRNTTLFDVSKAITFLHDFLSKERSFILVGPLIPFESLSFDLIIVLTCSQKKKLFNRLSKRNYKLSKINENIEAELLGEVLGNTLDWLFAIGSNRNPIIIDTCKLNINEIIKKIQTHIYDYNQD